MLSEKSQSEKVTCPVIRTVWHSGKRQSRRYSKMTSGPQGLWGEKGVWPCGAQGFLGQWKYPGWHYHDGYVTFCICQNPQNVWRGELSCDLGIWLTYQYWFISCNACITLKQDVNTRRRCRWDGRMGEEGYGKSLSSLFSFSVNLGLL